MLGRLTTAVQGAVSNVSTSVQNAMGEEIYRLYDMPKDSTASGGHELLWKIYPGISKKTGQEVSIFVFDKDQIRKQPKEIQDRIMDIMRTDMKTLRLLRHPHVLKVEEVFEETKRLLSFVTEKVVCSVANACKQFDNVGNVTPEIMEIGLADFETACGLMHIGEALSFLHREGRRVHLSIGPQSIFITTKGEWKLAGLGFSRVVEPGKLSRSEYYQSQPQLTGKEKVAPLRTEPPLSYCAPELVTEPRQFSSSADMFSLGLVIYELYGSLNPDGTRSPVLDIQDSNPMSHGYKVQSLHPIHFPSSVPPTLHNTIRSLVSVQPTQRPEPRAFLASQFFDTGPIKTLRTLQCLVEHDPAQQAKFLQGLTEQLGTFPHRVLRDMVIPGLQSVSINSQLTPFVITPLLKIVEILDKPSFGYMIAPMLAPLLALTEPVQCMLMFATNLNVIIPKADDAFIRDHVVPMLCRCLDSSVPEILDTVLNKIVDQANLFEYRILKQTILPRVTKLILQPPQMSVRVNALLWLAKSYHVFDKDLLAETVLPALSQCLEVDKSPAVCMCILGCYDNLGRHLGAETLAVSILPSVTPLFYERALNASQFDIVCQKVQGMVQFVISERDKQFMSENSVRSATSNLEQNAGISAAVRAVADTKEKSSGAAAANAMLQEGPVVAPPREENRNPKNDDPYYLGSRTSSSGDTKPREAGVNISSKRRLKKKERRAKAAAENSGKSSDILDLASTDIAPPSSQPVGNMFGNLTVASSSPAASYAQPPMSQGNNLFNGMAQGGVMHGGIQPQGMAAMGPPNPPAFGFPRPTGPAHMMSGQAMAPPLHQQPPPPVMQGGFPNQGGQPYSSGTLNPQQRMLQNGQQSQSNSSDPFSAFDGL